MLKMIPERASIRALFSDLSVDLGRVFPASLLAVLIGL
jgi:hypothetical protein